jgi:hypothetical protein
MMPQSRNNRPGLVLGRLIRGLAGLLLLALLGRPALSTPPDAGEHRVRLHSGQVLEGAVRQIQPSLYLVQTDDQLYEITGEEIETVDGKPGVSELPVSQERLLRYEGFEVVAPNGDVELWSRFQTTNESSQVWTYVEWGAAEWELEMYRTMEAYDKYGHRLQHRIEPRSTKGQYSVIVDLQVPLAPGESVDLATKYLEPGQAHREGDGFRLSFVGDFPDDRIYLRKVELPQGAEIEKVEPDATLTFQHEGHPIVVWRRYYPKGEKFPLTVVYRVPGQP